MNCKIDPVLYDFFLTLKQTLGAEIVHRRKRISQTCIEIIFNNDLLPAPSERLNSLRDAERCGFWIICRKQTKHGHTIYKGRRVFQLFLSPVHPKKRREKVMRITARKTATTLAAAITA